MNKYLFGQRVVVCNHGDQIESCRRLQVDPGNRILDLLPGNYLSQRVADTYRTVGCIPPIIVDHNNVVKGMDLETGLVLKIVYAVGSSEMKMEAPGSITRVC